jgi:hypothetical protein
MGSERVVKSSTEGVEIRCVIDRLDCLGIQSFSFRPLHFLFRLAGTLVSALLGSAANVPPPNLL